MAEEALNAAVLAALPEDAPPGHRAHAKVKLIGRTCKIAYSKGRGGIINYQTSVRDCGSELVALRIARAMWLRLEAGATKDEVTRFKTECCFRVKAAGGAGTKRGRLSNEDEKEAEGAEDEAQASTPGRASGSGELPAAASSSSSSSGAKRRKSTLSSPQGELPSCGRRSSSSLLSSSTLSPFGVKIPLQAQTELSFGHGVRTLREALVHKGLETRGSWAELVRCLQTSEEAEPASAGSPLPAAASASASPGGQALPTVDLTVSKADLTCSQEPPAWEAAVEEELAAAPARAPEPANLAVKRKFGMKRPPATPQRRASTPRVSARV